MGKMETEQIFSVYTGVDIIEIERVARAYHRRPQLFLKRFFTNEEQRRLASRKHIEKHLAARFAAKEAIAKLLGLGIGHLSWTDVEILSLPNGAPTVRLHGRAAERAAQLALGQVALSLSHSKFYAVAQAVALSTKKQDRKD